MNSLPLILFLVLFFIIVVPITVIIIVVVVKGRNQSWKGTITDKLENTKRDFDTNREETFYTACIKLDTGKDIKMAVDRDRYNDWNVGDKLEKIKGESWPKKV